ncbi:MAG: hypothetical protein ACI9DF_004115 [Verrucomicrobiales bacterium]|jgi:hypothetical protein
MVACSVGDLRRRLGARCRNVTVGPGRFGGGEARSHGKDIFVINPEIDEEQLQAVFDDASSYYLDSEDLELLREFLSMPAWMREDVGRQDRETLLRIQVSTFALFQSRRSEG